MTMMSQHDSCPACGKGLSIGDQADLNSKVTSVLVSATSDPIRLDLSCGHTVEVHGHEDHYHLVTPTA